MIYHLTISGTDSDGYGFVHDFYFATKKEAVAFIKGLPFGTGNEWSPEAHVTLTKVKLPTTQKEWAWSLNNLVSCEIGVYQGSRWFGREVSKQTWTHEDGKWSAVEVTVPEGFELPG